MKNTIFKLIAFVFDLIVKAFFKIITSLYSLTKWCLSNKRKAVEGLWGGILVMGILIFFSSLRIGTEVCDGSKGEMNINPEGFVANHLIHRCDNADGIKFIQNANAMEDYSTSLPDYPLEFGAILKADMVDLVGNYNPYQRKWVSYAWRISHDKEFLYMLKAENGLFNHDRRSLYVSNGVQEPSYGFCQIHRGYHPEIVNDPRFNDPAWQLAQCYKLWKGGTAFYGHHRIKKDPAYRARIESHFKFY